MTEPPRLLGMDSQSEVLRAFLSMREGLQDGGILVMSTGMSDRMWRESPLLIPEIRVMMISCDSL